MIFSMWDEEDVACLFGRFLVEDVGREKAEEIDRMNRSGVLGRYCASFEYCEPIQYLYKALDTLEMSREDWLVKDLAWKMCREEGFLTLADRC